MALYVKAAGGNSNAAGTWSNVSSAGGDSSGPPSAADDCIAELGSGQLTVNAALSVKSFSTTAGTGAYTGIITHNAGFVWQISGALTFSAGMTYTPTETSTLQFNTSATVTTGGKLLPLVVAGATTLTLGDNMSFIVSKLTSITYSGTGSINLAGFTISGNSATNRVMIKSSALGTARVVTIASGTFANADFRDITFSSASNLDLSAITGLSGNCGGNTLTGGGSTLTFTPATTQTWDGTTGSASTSASWTSRTPLPQDTVAVASGTVTFDMPRSGGNITFSGTGNGTFSSTTDVYGSLTLRSGMTLTQSATISLMSRTTSTITSAGNTFTNLTQTAFGGTYTLQDAMLLSGTYTHSNGTLIDGGNTLSCAIFSSAASLTRAITRTGVWTVTSTGTVYSHGSITGLTLTDSGTVFVSDTSASAKTFSGGGTTYQDLKIAGGGAGTVTIAGANSFNRIYTDGGGTKSIILPGSATTTIRSGTGLANGSNVITFTSSAGSATVSKAAGIVDWKAVNLTAIVAAATGAKYFAGVAPPSVDGGGNTNWTFLNAPSGGTALVQYSAGPPFSAFGLF